MMILGQAVTPELIKLGSGAAGLILLREGFRLYREFTDSRDRKIIREEAVKQTKILEIMQYQLDRTCKYKIHVLEETPLAVNKNIPK